MGANGIINIGLEHGGGILLTTILIGLLALNTSFNILLIVYSLRQKKYISKIETEYNELNEKYRSLAGEYNHAAYAPIPPELVDSLTGLPHRQIFEDRLVQAINTGKRQKSTFAVIALDVDDLGEINKLGHDIGDRALKELALRIQSSIRQVDTLTRFSGGCFLILLPSLQRAETAIYAAQRIQDATLQNIKIASYELSVKVSMGIAIYPLDGEDVKTLIQHAEAALQQAKKSGKNKYQFYQRDIHDLGTRELSIASLVRSDEIYKRIVIKYNPFFTVDKNATYIQVTKHLQHPEWGLIPFSSITHILENSGKWMDIKMWLLKNALQQFKKWHETGFKPSLLGLQISLHQLEDPQFIAKLIETMQETRSKIELVLEISDDVIRQNPAYLEKVFNMLNESGIKVAVGVIALGHFAMQKINRIPLNYLLIDAKISQSITDTGKVDVVRQIIELAKAENITVMAEGIETKEQQDHLANIGCGLMGGKIYGYLMPSGDILEKEL